jgi:hypothetical protein
MARYYGEVLEERGSEISRGSGLGGENRDSECGCARWVKKEWFVGDDKSLILY